MDSFRMGETNINVLVQSIERSLHLIYKNIFLILSLYQYVPYQLVGDVRVPTLLSVHLE